MIESKEELLGHIERAFDFYLAQGKKKERFGHTLDRIGLDKAFAEIFSEENGAKTPATRHSASARRTQSSRPHRRLLPHELRASKARHRQDQSRVTVEILLDDGEPIVNVTQEPARTRAPRPEEGPGEPSA